MQEGKERRTRSVGLWGFMELINYEALAGGGEVHRAPNCLEPVAHIGVLLRWSGGGNFLGLESCTTTF